VSDAGVALSPHHVLLLHLAVTAFLCGLIWVVQLVHYPMFERVERDGFAAFEAVHQRRITWIVMPAMVVEAATAGWWMLASWRAGEPVLATALNAGLVVVIWASTAWLQVPQHARLARGFDRDAHRRLVASNWLRTAAWSTRTALLLVVAWRSIV
jgi:uncharacterized membrane protein